MRIHFSISFKSPILQYIVLINLVSDSLDRKMYLLIKIETIIYLIFTMYKFCVPVLFIQSANTGYLMVQSVIPLTMRR